MKRAVVIAPEADADLDALYEFIAGTGGPAIAIAYLNRLQRYYMGFADFPERGTLQPELGRGIRIVGFERRATIAFRFDDTAVYIDRILYGGRDLGSAFD